MSKQIMIQANKRLVSAVRASESVRASMDADAFAIVAVVNDTGNVSKHVVANDLASMRTQYASMLKRMSARDSIVSLVNIIADDYHVSCRAAAHMLASSARDADAQEATPEKSANVRKSRSTVASERTLRAQADASARKTATQAKSVATQTKSTTPRTSRASSASASAQSKAPRTHAQNDRELATIAKYAAELKISDAKLRREFGTLDASVNVYALRAVKSALRERVTAQRNASRS